MAEDIALNFHDSLLRRSDVALLKEGCWLNDQLIGFAFEYFQHKLYPSLDKKVVFISPEVTQFIKMSSEDELPIFLEPLDLSSKDIIFLALNDSETIDAAGSGSHWSLLVFCRHLNACAHFDSANSYNYSAARKLTKKLGLFVKTDNTSVNFMEGFISQQTNGSDCGVYTITAAENICKYLSSVSASSNLDIPLRIDVDPPSITKKRKELEDIIECLYNEGYK